MALNTTVTEGGVSYWTGFDNPTAEAPVRNFSADGTVFKPGSHRPTSNTLWRSRAMAVLFTTNSGASPDIISLDLLKDRNRKSHHTDKYGAKNFVLRRGQEANIKIVLNVPFNAASDRLQLVLTKGDSPQESKGTLVRVDLYGDKWSAMRAKRGFDWLGYITAVSNAGDSSEVSVSLTSNADTLVGSYKIRTNLYQKQADGQLKRFFKEEEEDIYVLFNPWHADDQVFMADESWRNEYVLNETGRIWVGSAFWNSGRAWNFAQFSEVCLKAAVYLLDESYLKPSAHGNATLVCRAMSAMVNNNDWDRGVLVGNWSGKYDGGTSPSKWIGSEKILTEYMKNKRSVRFGQCWVFSGVLTTVCRALGIPTRSVTNFDSAHDVDMSMTIDTHISSTDGESVDSMRDDSVWNFHVWNEAHLKRPDLPPGYDGWQAFDSTPQESSEGKMQCGPSPVLAIKQGNVYLQYDTKFIFAEVNADRLTWIVDENGDRKPKKDSLKKASVGNQISTKKVGNNLLNDITGEYKHKEGTTEERETVTRATTFSSRKEELGDLYSSKADDVEFTITHEMVKGDIKLVFIMHNTSSQVRRVFARATAHAMYYTGATGEKLGDTSGYGVLQPGQKSRHPLNLYARYYLNIIDEDAMVKLNMFAKVTQTDQIFYESNSFRVEKPDAMVEVSNLSPQVGEPFTVTIKVTNPVKVPLTGAVIHLEGPGITKNREIPIGRTINGEETITEEVELTAKYPGKREVIVGFNSRQITGITGAIEVDVQSKDEGTAIP